MSGKEITYGFGFNPGLSLNHFYVEVPSTGNQPVQVYERFHWDDAEQQILGKEDILRIEISKYKWNKVSSALTAEFNARLKRDKMRSGKFIIGGTPIERLFGKELMVLLWSIEDSDPFVIPAAIRNWSGLMPEERRWLYTMTNASTGHPNDKKGWRIALRYALCENPVEQLSMHHLLNED
jgi:hypothetical protein